MDDPPGLSTKSRIELKQECKRLGLEARGQRSELLGRITAYYEEQRASEERKRRAAEKKRREERQAKDKESLTAERIAKRQGRKPPRTFTAFHDPPVGLYLCAVEIKSKGLNPSDYSDDPYHPLLPRPSSPSLNGECDEEDGEDAVSDDGSESQTGDATTTIPITTGGVDDSVSDSEDEAVPDVSTNANSDRTNDKGSSADVVLKNAEIRRNDADLEMENVAPSSVGARNRSTAIEHDKHSTQDEQDVPVMEPDFDSQTSTLAQRSQVETEKSTKDVAKDVGEAKKGQAASEVDNVVDITMHDATQDLMQDEESEQARDPSPRTPLDDMEDLDFIINSALNEDLGGDGLPDIMDMSNVSVDMQDHKEAYVNEEQRQSQHETEEDKEDDDSSDLFEDSDKENEVRNIELPIDTTEKKPTSQKPTVTERPVQFRIPGLFINDEKEAGEALLSLAAEAPKEHEKARVAEPDSPSQQLHQEIRQTSISEAHIEQESAQPQPPAVTKLLEPVHASEPTSTPVHGTEKTQVATSPTTTKKPRDPESEKAVQDLIAKINRGIAHKKSILETKKAKNELIPDVTSQTQAKAGTSASEAQSSEPAEKSAEKPAQQSRAQAPPTTVPAKPQPVAQPETLKPAAQEPESTQKPTQQPIQEYDPTAYQGYPGSDAQGFGDYSNFLNGWDPSTMPISYNPEDLEVYQQYYSQWGIDYKAWMEAARAQQQYQQEQWLYEQEQQKKQHLNRPVDYTDVPVPVSQPPVQAYNYWGSYQMSSQQLAPMNNAVPDPTFIPPPEVVSPLVPSSASPQEPGATRSPTAQEHKKRKRPTSPPPTKPVEAEKPEAKKQKQTESTLENVMVEPQQVHADPTAGVPLPFSEALNAQLAKTDSTPLTEPMQTEEPQPIAASTPKAAHKAFPNETVNSPTKSHTSATAKSKDTTQFKIPSTGENRKRSLSTRGRKQIVYSDPISPGSGNALSPPLPDDVTFYAPTGPRGSRQLYPPLHRPTTYVYVANLPCPFNELKLRNYIATLAEPDTYNEFLEGTPSDPIQSIFIDKYRSHAYIAFRNQSQATSVRNELHGAHWPDDAFPEDRIPKNQEQARMHKQLKKRAWSDFFEGPQFVEWVVKERNNQAERWVVRYNDDENGECKAELVVCRSKAYLERQEERQAAGLPPDESFEEELPRSRGRKERRNRNRSDTLESGSQKRQHADNHHEANDSWLHHNTSFHHNELVENLTVNSNVIPIKNTRRNLAAIAALTKEDEDNLVPPLSTQQYKPYRIHQEEPLHNEEPNHDNTHHDLPPHDNSHHDQPPPNHHQDKLPRFPHLYPPLQTFGGPAVTTHTSLTLEDLFCVTKTVEPKIYYLPVKEEVALERLRRMRAGDFSGVRKVTGARRGERKAKGKKYRKIPQGE